jgi:hypothetical protein
MKAISLILVSMLILTQSASAQGKCEPTETPNACVSRLMARSEQEVAKDAEKTAAEEAEAEFKAEAGDETWERLIRKATGLNMPDIDLESATEDFLPLLRFAFAAAGLQDDLDVSALNFERKIGTIGSWELKLKGAANDAEVFAPLKEAFDEQVREQRVKELEEKLGDLDDYSLTLDLNRRSESYGRTPNSYSQEVFQSLLEQVVRIAKFDDASDFALLETLEKLNVSPDTPIAELPPGTALVLTQAIEASAGGAARTVNDLKQQANDLAIFQVADLLNNQPQINASGGYRKREGTAGPDEFTIKASYEYGFVNLNRLRKICGRPSSTTLMAFAACYGNFMKDAGRQAQIKHGDRFSITAEYNEVDAFRFSQPEDHVDLNFDSQQGLVITGAYARLIDVSAEGEESARIDVTGKYESEEDRGVISLTYTNRLLKSLGGSIGISYANHERFLPDSDRVVSAHFGFSFNSFSKDPPKTQ